MSTESVTLQSILRKIYHFVRLLLTILLLALATIGLYITLRWVGGKIWLALSAGFTADTNMARFGAFISFLLLAIIPAALISVISGILKGGERQLFVRRYLQHKIAPLFALTAVMLCTAMVIIVSSIMGGFIHQMSESAHSLTGDVVVRGDITGFPHYEQLIEALEKRPEIRAASPVAKGYGLMKLHGDSNPVEVYGIDPKSLSRVTDFEGSLYWQKERIDQEGVELDELIASKKKRGEDTEALTWMRGRFERYRQVFSPYDLKKLGMALKVPDAHPFNRDRSNPKTSEAAPTGSGGSLHGAVLGIEVNKHNTRTDKGSYLFRRNSSVAQQLHLTVLPVAQGGVLTEPTYERLVVVNESKSGFYEFDANRIYIAFDLMQKLLHMEASESYENYEEVNGELVGVGEKIIVPGRASEIVVRGEDGYPLETILQIVRDEREALSKQYPGLDRTYVITWQELFGTLLGAVNNEKGLLIFLFAMISLVSAVMVGVIFYMIVMEKTRDIGTLRAIGASRGGIISVFLAYGLCIGASGACLGMALAELVVNHINDIHNWLRFGIGQGYVIMVCTLSLGLLGAIGGGIYGGLQPFYKGNLLERITRNAATFGFLAGLLGVLAGLGMIEWMPEYVANQSLKYSITIWDPRVYFFDEIPTHMEDEEVRLIVTGAVCASVIGALVPAYLAGVVDPVRSLRYE